VLQAAKSHFVRPNPDPAPWQFSSLIADMGSSSHILHTRVEHPMLTRKHARRDAVTMFGHVQDNRQRQETA